MESDASKISNDPKIPKLASLSLDLSTNDQNGNKIHEKHTEESEFRLKFSQLKIMLRTSLSSIFYRRSSFPIFSSSIIRHRRNYKDVATASSFATDPPMRQIDVITCAREDHSIIRHLGERFDKEMDNHEKQKIANTVILAIHSHTEEIIVYPELKILHDGENLADHSREEHLEIKKDLSKLDEIKVSDIGYNELFKKIMKTFDKHAREEENEIFPGLANEIHENKRKELGRKFIITRSTVPTRPHPSAPDKPPMEIAVGLATAPLDKLRDAPRDYVEIDRSYTK
ncbi:2047_t:CDS:2 [Diversispora eburnea]|uniref:2047_t:CDS:1 n=1 Tax=Diversispora eburnea TaxID=1213867 RepID=A0A9N8Z6Z3_9GLOM|nr:2047_t:CDS:2 [Diversispora eburnea]